MIIRRAVTCYVVLGGLSWCVSADATAQGLAANAVERGRELFTHEWSPNDPLCADGDGLGPLHNDVSCAACHIQGDIGGGGPVEKNVELLSVVIADDAKFEERARKVHPSFFVGSFGATVVLHRRGTLADYDQWRLDVLGLSIPGELDETRAAILVKAQLRNRRRQGAVVNLRPKAGLRMQLSQRNTPALFGAGLIDGIRADALLAAAERQAIEYPGVSGRVARITSTDQAQPGRFGWRGQISTLEEFVLTACAAELGLECPGHHQVADPRPVQPPDVKLDLTEGQCRDLLDFVASLPPPPELSPANNAQAVTLKAGRGLFQTAGCAACHMEQLGDVRGMYSDLLLHDMGRGLHDPTPAPPDTRLIPGSPVQGGYGGAVQKLTVVIPTEVHQEWRTPPLWGVRLSAPYMHDGRAKTLHDAIMEHGGEAAFAVERYKAMPNLGRSQLLAFVNSLGAPDGTP
jgi:CxxC motif-containing protein (DUF1111 family)